MSRGTSFYRRPLPESQVAFSSAEGRRLFREALAAGTLEQVRARGLTLDELGCLATCNGARVTVVRASDASADDLRRALERSARATDAVLVASYDRSALGQTGQGHFSPVGGVHVGRDLALLLDVARFKYPPHWVSIERLHAAMLPIDPATSHPRGWLELAAESRPRPIFLQLGLPSRGWSPVLERVARQARDPELSLEHWAMAMAQSVPELGEIVHTLAQAFGSELEPEHRRLVDELLAQVRGTRPYRALVELGAATLSSDAPTLAPEALAVLAHVLAPAELDSGAIGGPLGDEIAALRGQIAALCSSTHTC